MFTMQQRRRDVTNKSWVCGYEDCSKAFYHMRDLFTHMINERKYCVDACINERNTVQRSCGLRAFLRHAWQTVWQTIVNSSCSPRLGQFRNNGWCGCLWYYRRRRLLHNLLYRIIRSNKSLFDMHHLTKSLLKNRRKLRCCMNGTEFSLHAKESICSAILHDLRITK